MKQHIWMTHALRWQEGLGPQSHFHSSHCSSDENHLSCSVVISRVCEQQAHLNGWSVKENMEVMKHHLLSCLACGRIWTRFHLRKWNNWMLKSSNVHVTDYFHTICALPLKALTLSFQCNTLNHVEPNSAGGYMYGCHGFTSLSAGVRYQK